VSWPLIGVSLLALKLAGDAAFTALAWGSGVFSVLFSLAAVAAAVRFFRFRSAAVWDRTPPITVIKPLKGLDRELYENLASFCRLDYPRYQLLFTLASPDDPALAVLSRLRADFPRVDMEIIVSKNRIGYNPKINNASNAAPFIKHGLLLISDSDVRVRPDFLRRMAAPLRDEAVGLVTAFYQATRPKGVWARMEALSVNAQFLPQAVLAAAFGMRFAMGAAMLVRREAFDAAGGFQTMADHLADDFILGEGVKAAGYKIEIADCVVESLPDHGGFLEHLRHQARWARTIRICNPEGYCGTLALHGFSLLTLKLFLFGPDALSVILAFAVLAAKGLAKMSISAWCLGDLQSYGSLLLLPWSEWVAFGAWLSGFRANQVAWRGELYAVQPQGRLTPVGAAVDGPSPVSLRS
jgi:ceramide glucosyltransferase